MKRFNIVALYKKMLHFFPWMCVWYKMKTSGSLPPSEESLLGGKLMGGRAGEADTRNCTHLHTHTHTHTHTTHTHTLFHCFPTEGTLTEAALPVTVAAIILQALSTDHLLQVSTLLTTSLSTHILSMHTDTREGGGHAAHPPVHILNIFIDTSTHIWLQTPGCAFHPQFALHKLMARTNRNDVLVQTSCSSQEKHTSLRGCECSCKRAHIPLLL